MKSCYLVNGKQTLILKEAKNPRQRSAAFLIEGFFLLRNFDWKQFSEK